MRLFPLAKPLDEGELLQLDENESRRLKNVLRLETGALLEGRDDAGFLYKLQIAGSKKRLVSLSVLEKREPILKGIHLELWQALLKGQKFEEAVRMAVEAGAAKIVPVIADYCEAKRQAEGFKELRWQRIAREACSQSGNLRFKGIGKPQSLKEAAAGAPLGALKLFCHQEPLAGASLHALVAGHNLKKHPVIVIIGPEGGFSACEADFLQKAGFFPLYLGDTVLKAETAGIFALGGIKMIAEEKSAWSVL